MINDMDIKKLRLKIGMSQRKFAKYFNIPKRTIENWESGQRTPPEYVVELIKYKIEGECKKVIKELIQEAKDNQWVVITDKGEIWGSEASLSALKMGGGKSYIFKASDIREWEELGVDEQIGLHNWADNNVVWLNEVYEHILECRKEP